MEDGLSRLRLPASHIISNGRVKASHIEDSANNGIRTIGRWGDVVTFDQLPDSVRTPGLAEALGVTISPATGVAGVEQCGAPGEVETTPAKDFQLHINNFRCNNVIDHTQGEIPHNGQQHAGNTMQIVHTNTALAAPDQLRQRVAWSLAQVVVAAIPGAGQDVREGWTNFYDVFVRHAFGSYYNILREVSYSPIMAYWLTYHKNKAWAASGTVPDENYAREIMQLFSLGLWMLNEDGTQALDGNGQPVPTYTNADIVTHARMWTGFKERDVRGNQEVSRNQFTHNEMDPMVIEESWRDTHFRR